MNLRRSRVRFLACVVVGLAFLIGCVAAQADGSWGYEAMPFLWASGLEGEQGFDGNVANVGASFNDLVEFLDVGGALRFRAYKPPLGWFAEIDNVKLTDDVATQLGNLKLQSEQTLAEVGLSYDITPVLALYGGLRYQQANLRFEALGVHVDNEADWVDAIAGVRWTPVQSDHWVAWARADVGAGGSDLVWLAEVGGGYRWGERWGSYLAYRVLDTDYRSGRFVYDARQEGLLLGFGVRF